MDISIKLIKEKLKKEKVFVVAFFLSIISSFIKAPKLSYINFKVLALLFNLMIVIAALKKLKVMDKAAMKILSKCSNTRMVSMVFIMVTFFSSMLVTNDVALLTFVPLAIFTFKKAKEDCMKTVIIQTLAANIGSSLTPMGNPQNLFLFTHYNLNGLQFFSVTIPFVGMGLVWILILNKRVLKKGIKVSIRNVHIEDKKRTVVYAILFLVIIASVFGGANYKYTFLAAILCTLFMNREIIKEVDYFLLFTFICFFVFIGNVSNIEFVQQQLKSFLKLPHMVYFSSIMLSQVVSNVPCAILISNFTTNWREVLLGVNIGGIGTMIASLASLISYKIYANEFPETSKKYSSKFNYYNFFSLLLFCFVIYFMI